MDQQKPVGSTIWNPRQPSSGCLSIFPCHMLWQAYGLPRIRRESYIRRTTVCKHARRAAYDPEEEGMAEEARVENRKMPGSSAVGMNWDFSEETFWVNETKPLLRPFFSLQAVVQSFPSSRWSSESVFADFVTRACFSAVQGTAKTFRWPSSPKQNLRWKPEGKAHVITIKATAKTERIFRLYIIVAINIIRFCFSEWTYNATGIHFLSKIYSRIGVACQVELLFCGLYLLLA